MRNKILAGLIAVVLAGSLIYVINKKVAPAPAPSKMMVAGNPWVRTFSTTRIVNVKDANSLTLALSAGQSGDELALADGTYVGNFTLAKPNVMVRCKGHCTINGNFTLSAQNTWLWGVEVFSTVSGTGLINAVAADTVVVNNYAHSDGQTENIVCYFTSENNYPNQIGYGNIFEKCEHDAYIQHEMSQGIEYLVANYFGEPLQNGNGRLLHAYAQTPNKTEAIYIAENIFNKGEVLIGGEKTATIPIFNIVKGNVFNQANLQLGYKRPNATDVIDNWFLNSILLAENFFGEGSGVQPPTDDISTVTGNHFYNEGIKYGWDHFRFKTAAYEGTGIVAGSPRIRSQDVWDNNWYHVTDYLRAPFNAGGVNTYLRSLSEWQKASEAAGKKFDEHATVSQGPPADAFKFVPNEYDPTRGLLAVFSYTAKTTVAVTLPANAELRSVSDPYGPVVTLCLAYPCSVPVAEFSVYVVNLKPTLPCDLSTVEKNQDQALMYLNQQKYNKCRATLNAARLALKPCL